MVAQREMQIGKYNEGLNAENFTRCVYFYHRDFIFTAVRGQRLLIITAFVKLSE